jgi:glutamate-1-semialdehyde 2,1-aminomutase
MRQFTQSERMLARAERVIPLGSQTFSKSRTQYPLGVSPLFIQRGQGARVWDVDGNDYVDFVNSLAAVTLGYNDPDVTAAVRAQLDEGTIFSLPHPLETEVAELIVEMVPCAEMVRFGKNGSDATAGAIRLARAFTGRDHVIVTGYHGWQDWYIGSTPRHRGVPEATRALTHSAPYGDIAAVEALFARYPGAIAGLIMEPMNTDWPPAGYLEALQALCRREGTVLIFDETITGFRYAPGGAQEVLGVTPDLACFGKGLANGYPVSAVTGRRDIMMLMEEVFFSFTFGGETLSLAAAKATLEKLKRERVTEQLAARGQLLLDGAPPLIESAGLGDVLAVKGHPSWTFLTIADAGRASSFEIKTFMMQELHQRGFLWLGLHNISYAHSEEDIGGLLGAYAEILPQIADALEKGDLASRIRGQTLVPLFKLR